MADRLLDAVIRLENQIQQQLRQEQLKADAWLAGVRTEQVAELQQLEQQLAAENDQLLQAANQQAKDRAATLVADEMQYCTCLEEISDEVLLQVLTRQLVAPLVNPSG
jgi:vacuolar-type H+-ATPase subunit H